MKRVTEAQTTSTFIAQGRKAGKYKTKPGDRYSARLSIKPEGSSVGWFEQDTNLLFKTGKYLFNIPVQGATNQYNVTIEIPEYLPLLKKALNEEPFSVQTFQRTLSNALAANKIKCGCNCADFIYRWNYTATLGGDTAVRPENRPSVITNPTNQKGSCKHILFVLAKLSAWTSRVSRNLFNYVFDLWKNNRQLFDRIIRPALDISDEKIENRPIKPRYSGSKSKVLEPVQAPAETVPDSEKKEETEGATEAINSYYEGRQIFDEDQEFILAIAKENGADVSTIVTPENTPEQIAELSTQLLQGTEYSLLQKLADPSLPPRSIVAIAKAARQGVDLLAYRNFAPDVLEQFTRAARFKVPIEEVALPGFNAKQVEQLTSAYLLSKQLFRKLIDSKANYEEMREAIREYKQR